MPAGNTLYIQWRGLGAEPKVWDLFSNFTAVKIRAVHFWSPLKGSFPDAELRVHNPKKSKKSLFLYVKAFLYEIIGNEKASYLGL